MVLFVIRHCYSQTWSIRRFSKTRSWSEKATLLCDWRCLTALPVTLHFMCTQSRHIFKTESFIDTQKWVEVWAIFKQSTPHLRYEACMRYRFFTVWHLWIYQNSNLATATRNHLRSQSPVICFVASRDHWQGVRYHTHNYIHANVTWQISDKEVLVQWKDILKQTNTLSHTERCIQCHLAERHADDQGAPQLALHMQSTVLERVKYRLSPFLGPSLDNLALLGHFDLLAFYPAPTLIFQLGSCV